MTKPRHRHRPNGDHSRDPEVLKAIKPYELEYNPDLDKWEQQPRESDRNFGLFKMYRDMGPIRSVAQLAEMAPISYSALARISRLNKWVERAKAWDAEQDRLYSLMIINKRKEASKRHVRAAQALMLKALARLEQIDMEKIGPYALVQMINTAAQIERAALGFDDRYPQTTVAVTTQSDGKGQPTMRVEVGVMHQKIMGSLNDLAARMSPEQIAAGHAEIAAEAARAAEDVDAALPAAPPPQ